MNRDSTRGRRATPPTRKSLLGRLKNWQDQESWQEFYQIYEKLIYATALKSGLTNVEAQEVLQETCLAVAKKIAGFNYDPHIGSFRSWLLLITRRRIVDQLRKRRPTTELHGLETNRHAAPHPDTMDCRMESLWNEEWHLALLEMARRFVKAKVSPKHYRMFELYALEQQPMRKVTESLGVNAAQVYMAKYRITLLLKKEIKRLEKKTL